MVKSFLLYLGGRQGVRWCVVSRHLIGRVVRFVVWGLGVWVEAVQFGEEFGGVAAGVGLVAHQGRAGAEADLGIAVVGEVGDVAAAEKDGIEIMQGAEEIDLPVSAEEGFAEEGVLKPAVHDGLGDFALGHGGGEVVALLLQYAEKGFLLFGQGPFGTFGGRGGRPGGGGCVHLGPPFLVYALGYLMYLKFSIIQT